MHGFRFLLLAISTVSAALAARIEVHTSEALMSAMQKAKAGDTLMVYPGTYTGDLDASGDPGNLPNGKGYFWIGQNGTAANPIVVVGVDSMQPPVLKGKSIDTGYVVHLTGNHIILKNLVITFGEKGVILDNSSHTLIEDCEVYNIGSELIHVRHASNHVTINRNKLHGSGNSGKNGGRGTFGEGVYIGTDQARWGAKDRPQSEWGEKAISEGYGGYDWRVHHTRVLCNFFSGGISAELLDVKEGAQHTLVKGNMLVGDSIGLKPGARDYDDSFIDQKGVKGTFVDNAFCACGNKITRFIVEEPRSKFPHIPDSLTADKSTRVWCDDSGKDQNDCSADKNSIVSVVTDPRPGCAEFFIFAEK